MASKWFEPLALGCRREAPPLGLLSSDGIGEKLIRCWAGDDASSRRRPRGDDVGGRPWSVVVASHPAAISIVYTGDELGEHPGGRRDGAGSMVRDRSSGREVERDGARIRLGLLSSDGIGEKLIRCWAGDDASSRRRPRGDPRGDPPKKVVMVRENASSRRRPRGDPPR